MDAITCCDLTRGCIISEHFSRLRLSLPIHGRRSWSLYLLIELLKTKTFYQKSYLRLRCVAWSEKPLSHQYNSESRSRDIFSIGSLRLSECRNFPHISNFPQFESCLIACRFKNAGREARLNLRPGNLKISFKICISAALFAFSDRKICLNKQNLWNNVFVDKILRKSEV